MGTERFGGGYRFARSERRLSMSGGAGGCAMIGLGVTVTATGHQRGSEAVGTISAEARIRMV
ncbi:hypothetical protein ACH4Q6_11995 [Streptomyces lydicus]|uniref:hypothetical protein n=1 Tax=Streptomyces lydicus TaxID=47763 RepID=UPI0037B3373B